jgi:hypothetical protein
MQGAQNGATGALMMQGSTCQTQKKQDSSHTGEPGTQTMAGSSWHGTAAACSGMGTSYCLLQAEYLGTS